MKQIYNHNFGELPYVMKEHWATRIHHDIRLQWKGVLLSWAMPVHSLWRVGEVLTAVEMEDHDPASILFEGLHKTGPILVWDCGTWEPHVEDGDVLACLESGFLRFTIRGEKLQGHFTLTRNEVVKGRRLVWELRKVADLSATELVDVGPGNSTNGCMTKSLSRSVCTGRTMDEVVRDWKKPRPDHPSFDWN